MNHSNYCIKFLLVGTIYLPILKQPFDFCNLVIQIQLENFGIFEWSSLIKKTASYFILFKLSTVQEKLKYEHDKERASMCNSTKTVQQYLQLRIMSAKKSTKLLFASGNNGNFQLDDQKIIDTFEKQRFTTFHNMYTSKPHTRKKVRGT